MMLTIRNGEMVKAGEPDDKVAVGKLSEDGYVIKDTSNQEMPIIVIGEEGDEHIARQTSKNKENSNVLNNSDGCLKTQSEEDGLEQDENDDGDKEIDDDDIVDDDGNNADDDACVIDKGEMENGMEQKGGMPDAEEEPGGNDEADYTKICRKSSKGIKDQSQKSSAAKKGVLKDYDTSREKLPEKVVIESFGRKATLMTKDLRVKIIEWNEEEMSLIEFRAVTVPQTAKGSWCEHMYVVDTDSFKKCGDSRMTLLEWAISLDVHPRAIGYRKPRNERVPALLEEYEKNRKKRLRAKLNDYVHEEILIDEANKVSLPPQDHIGKEKFTKLPAEAHLQKADKLTADHETQSLTCAVVDGLNIHDQAANRSNKRERPQLEKEDHPNEHQTLGNGREESAIVLCQKRFCHGENIVNDESVPCVPTATLDVCETEFAAGTGAHQNDHLMIKSEQCYRNNEENCTSLEDLPSRNKFIVSTSTLKAKEASVQENQGGEYQQIDILKYQCDNRKAIDGVSPTTSEADQRIWSKLRIYQSAREMGILPMHTSPNKLHQFSSSSWLLKLLNDAVVSKKRIRCQDDVNEIQAKESKKYSLSNAATKKSSQPTESGHAEVKSFNANITTMGETSGHIAKTGTKEGHLNDEATKRVADSDMSLPKRVGHPRKVGRPKKVNLLEETKTVEEMEAPSRRITRHDNDMKNSFDNKVIRRDSESIERQLADSRKLLSECLKKISVDPSSNFEAKADSMEKINIKKVPGNSTLLSHNAKEKETIKESSSRKTKDKDLHMNFYGDYSGPAATGPAATTINAYDDDYDEMVPRGIKSKDKRRPRQTEMDTDIWDGGKSDLLLILNQDNVQNLVVSRRRLEHLLTYTVPSKTGVPLSTKKIENLLTGTFVHIDPVHISPPLKSGMSLFKVKRIKSHREYQIKIADQLISTSIYLVLELPEGREEGSFPITSVDANKDWSKPEVSNFEINNIIHTLEAGEITFAGLDEDEMLQKIDQLKKSMPGMSKKDASARLHSTEEMLNEQNKKRQQKIILNQISRLNNGEIPWLATLYVTDGKMKPDAYGDPSKHKNSVKLIKLKQSDRYNSESRPIESNSMRSRFLTDNTGPRHPSNISFHREFHDDYNSLNRTTSLPQSLDAGLVDVTRNNTTGRMDLNSTYDDPSWTNTELPRGGWGSAKNKDKEWEKDTPLSPKKGWAMKVSSGAWTGGGGWAKHKKTESSTFGVSKVSNSSEPPNASTGIKERESERDTPLSPKKGGWKGGDGWAKRKTTEFPAHEITNVSNPSIPSEPPSGPKFDSKVSDTPVASKKNWRSTWGANKREDKTSGPFRPKGILKTTSWTSSMLAESAFDDGKKMPKLSEPEGNSNNVKTDEFQRTSSSHSGWGKSSWHGGSMENKVPQTSASQPRLIETHTQKEMEIDFVALDEDMNGISEIGVYKEQVQNFDNAFNFSEPNQSMAINAQNVEADVQQNSVGTPDYTYTINSAHSDSSIEKNDLEDGELEERNKAKFAALDFLQKNLGLKSE